MCLSVFFQCFVIIQILFFALLRHRLVKRRHRNIDMSFKDQFRHKAVEQRQEQCRDMGTVHVRISHDDDLIITQFADVKVISVSFGKSTAKCIDHCLDLCVCQYFIDTCFFHIQDLTTDWQDCLEHTVSGRLCRTSGRIPLHNENLTF